MNIFSSTFYYRKFQTYSKEKKFKVNTYIHNLSSPLIFDYICFTTLSILFERFVLNTSQIMCSFPWELLNTSSLLQCKSQPLEGSTRTQMISFDLHNGSLKFLSSFNIKETDSRRLSNLPRLPVYAGARITTQVCPVDARSILFHHLTPAFYGGWAEPPGRHPRLLSWTLTLHFVHKLLFLQYIPIKILLWGALDDKKRACAMGMIFWVGAWNV